MSGNRFSITLDAKIHKKSESRKLSIKKQKSHRASFVICTFILYAAIPRS